MFEFLFSYPASVWQDARLVFDSGWSQVALWVCMALALVVLGVSLLRLQLSPARKSVVALLQGAAVSIALFMLWQPALLVQGAEKGENTVAWLLDASSSMAIEDVPLSATSTQSVTSRYSAGLQLIESQGVADDADFEASLYAIDGDLTAVPSLEAFPDEPIAARTTLAGSIDSLLGTVSNNATAAVVLISDGSDNSDNVDASWWQALAAAGVPVHTVGTGRLLNPNDLQLTDVVVPKSSPPDALMQVRLKVSHSKAGTARVRVLAGDELLAAEDITLPEGMQNSEHIVSVPTGEEGVRQLEFTIETQDDIALSGLAVDPDLRNNRQARVVRIDDAARRVLYVEGEPRWEYKFLRRAVDQQPGVQIVSLLRTSANKFYRQGVRDASELADGFPVTREALFDYDAVIIGSMDAAELSTPQQSALRDFVNIRGGSLLMLGGRHGLADGGWGRSVTAAALPVLLDPDLNASTFARDRAYARPTLAGYRTPWLRLADNDLDNIEGWNELPELADFQSVGTVKPGAVTLLERVGSSASDQVEPLLVMQRYGRGKSLVLGTSGTWRWQMSLPSEDQKHERFWQQLTGMLVDDVMTRVAVDTGTQVYRDSDTATLAVTAFNPDYTALQQSSFPVQITLPNGALETLELIADGERAGLYTAQLPTQGDGPYAVMAMAPLGGESPQGSVSAAEHWWVHESGTAESFDPWQQRAFLQRVSEVTGGSYLSIEDGDELEELLARQNSALTRELQLPLWNMPLLFLLLLALKGLEWLLRLRWKRL
ncbi:MAG: hypothetical protein AB8B63_07380 [Granulosicoccus sp.]